MLEHSVCTHKIQNSFANVHKETRPIRNDWMMMWLFEIVLNFSLDLLKKGGFLLIYKDAWPTDWWIDRPVDWQAVYRYVGMHIKSLSYGPFMVVPRFYPLRVWFLQQYCPRLMCCFFFTFSIQRSVFLRFFFDVLKN